VDYQKITTFLIGNAVADAEVKLARDSEHRYGDFRLAVRDRNDETHYFPVRCFGKLAASVSAIQKGTKLFVDGELEIAAFEGEDGDKRMTFRVVANTYRILAGGRKSVTEPEAA
jgi:single-stranded DNA-binding protein